MESQRPAAVLQILPEFLYTEFMRAGRKKKRGRPRTGHDEAVTVRVPKKMLKTIATISDALGCDRSTAVRWMLEEALRASGLVIGMLRRGKGRTLAGQVARAAIADFKATKTAEHATRAPPKQKIAAEIRALRAGEERAAALVDAEATLRKRDARPLASTRSSIRKNESRPATGLSKAEIDAIVERAVSRSRSQKT